MPVSSDPPPLAPDGTLTPWRAQLRDAIRDPDELVDRLGLADELRPGARDAARAFPLIVPPALMARIRPGDPDDPILRQVLPLDAELKAPALGFVDDPLGEASAERAPGLLQKYSGRALMITAGVCAVGCRYCFRRAFPYKDGPGRESDWLPALRQLRSDTAIEEVILSGGDPLMQSDAWLARMVEQLEAIPHLRRLRVHTRLPIVIPDRVDDAFLAWIGTTRLTPTVVVHANHPNEVDEACGQALLRMVRAGIPVLNQSVLLRGVNDDANVLEELSRRLLDVRVMPYYLHQLDPVTGSKHFEVPVTRGLKLVERLRERLPGLGVPRYVREQPGAHSKTPLT